MKKIKNKIDTFFDAVFGNKVKNRGLKIVGSFSFILFLIFFMIFIIFNVGYNKKRGIYVKPIKTEIKVEVKK